MSGRESESRYVHEDRREIARESEGGFDRVGFAMRALRVLRPRNLTVAVHESGWGLKVDSGRAWGRGPDAKWAVLAVPPDATREHIAVAVAELAGVARDPFVIDMLIAAAAQVD